MNSKPTVNPTFPLKGSYIDTNPAKKYKIDITKKQAYETCTVILRTTKEYLNT